MYNHNYDGRDYVQIHSEWLNSMPNPKNSAYKPVSKGSIKMLCLIKNDNNEDVAYNVFNGFM